MPHKAHKPVVVVDENDKPTGTAPLSEVWKKGHYHRTVRVLVENKKGEVLLQRRAYDMELYPNCWDVSAGGHVDEDMTYKTAARQELVEELGLAEGDLEEIDSYKSEKTYEDRKLNRFNKTYLLHWNYTPELFNPDEVTEVRWFTKQEVLDLIKDHPDKVADGLVETATRLFESKK